jgi:hypothetical protein
MSLLLSWLLGATALARSGGGLGLTLGTAVEPVRPVWTDSSGVASLGCGGMQVRLLDDRKRVSIPFHLCARGSTLSFDMGAGVGRQTAGRVYAFADVDFGLSGYGVDAESNRYGTFLVFARPRVGVGTFLGDFGTAEVSLGVHSGIPVLRTVHNEAPRGHYWGHGLVQATFTFGEFRR